MSAMILTIIGLVVSALGIAARVVFWRSGRDKERLRDAEQTLEDVQKANNARADDSHDDSLRDKYGL